MKISSSFFLSVTPVSSNDAGKYFDKSISDCPIVSPHRGIIAELQIFVYSNVRMNRFSRPTGPPRLRHTKGAYYRANSPTNWSLAADDNYSLCGYYAL